ncbi:MAG: type III pantothenate kinase [Clostridiales bacterium]|nr:type III pantothenate kinase [Clostridiales bacterium]
MTIDQGNSSAKVAIWEGHKLVEHVTYTDIDDDEIITLVARHGVSRAMFCSVSHRQEWLQSLLAGAGVETHELNHSTALPLVIDYSTPGTLGVDRIAAAVGATTLHPTSELLVVDAGTAVTYDRVTSRGHFVGGNIAPGIGMRLKALHAYTSRLPLVSSRGETRLWGNSTENAMRSGAFNGVIAEITYYRSLLPHDAVVVIAGGWGRELASKLNFETDYQEYLVNRGLNDLLIYNENN